MHAYDINYHVLVLLITVWNCTAVLPQGIGKRKKINELAHVSNKQVN